MVDEFFDRESDSLLGFIAPIPREQRLRLLSEYLIASLISSPERALEFCQENQDQKQEVDIARQKLCLKEIAARYRKIVDRWEQLEPLSFQDSQFEEGSRAYLYGITNASASCAMTVFNRRNRVVHDDDEPDHDAAGEALDIARRVLTELAWCQRAAPDHDAGNTGQHLP